MLYLASFYPSQFFFSICKVKQICQIIQIANRILKTFALLPDKIIVREVDSALVVASDNGDLAKCIK